MRHFLFWFLHTYINTCGHMKEVFLSSNWLTEQTSSLISDRFVLWRPGHVDRLLQFVPWIRNRLQVIVFTVNCSLTDDLPHVY